jgi:hypothetical protein
MVTIYLSNLFYYLSFNYSYHKIAKSAIYSFFLLGLGTGDWGLGTGDWGFGNGDWGLGILTHPVFAVSIWIRDFPFVKLI